MDRLADLHLFLRIIDLGSISAAARSLDLSIAVASQRLQRLEKSLGVRLLHRTTRRLRLTSEGAELAEQGRSLVEELDALTSNLRRPAIEVAGFLRVSAPASFGRQYISPLLPAFLAQHPRLKLHVDLTDAMRDLASEGIDVAIRIGNLDGSNLAARRLAGNRRVLCAAPSYLKKHGAPKTPHDLTKHECLLLLSGTQAQDVWHLQSASGKKCGVRVRGRLVSNMGEVIRDAALAGQGIALHSIWHICEDLRANRLQLVLPNFRLPDSGIYAVMPQRFILPRVRALIDFLAREFGDPPPWDHSLPATQSRKRA